MYKVEVIKVISFKPIVGAFKVKVKAKTEEGKTFTYVFIKRDEGEAKSIIPSYTWEMGCKPNIY